MTAERRWQPSLGKMDSYGESGGIQEVIRLGPGMPRWTVDPGCLPAASWLPFPQPKSLSLLVSSPFLGAPSLGISWPVNRVSPYCALCPAFHVSQPSLPSALRWLSGPQGPQTWFNPPSPALQPWMYSRCLAHRQQAP